MGKIDLHLHSYYSDDGQYSPTELIQLCREADVDTLAIADHNAIKAIDEGMEAARAAGLTYLPATELDCIYKGTYLHVLGLNIDHHDPRYQKLADGIVNQEKAASAKRMELVEALGIKLDHELIKKLAVHGVVTGEIMAEAALADPRNEHNELLLSYRESGARSDNPFVNFYWDVCAPGKPGDVRIYYDSLEDILNIIHSTGGKAILAHPGLNLKGKEEQLDGIVAAGIDGIEVFSSYHNAEEIRFYQEYAKNSDLIMTCGSDFHGKTKPKITIGCVSRDFVKEEYLNRILGDKS